VTPQNLTHVDFQEVQSIDITCKECGSLLRLILPKESLSQHFACAGCNTQLWGRMEDSDYLNILGFLRALSRHQREAKGFKYSIGFTLPSADRVSSAKQG